MRAEVRLEVRSILKRLDATAVFVTHDQEEAFVFADRVAVMNDGRLEQVDRPEVLYNQPASHFVADFVGHGNFLPATVVAGVVQTELGAMRVRGATSDGPVHVLVRPHDIALLPGKHELSLVVRERRFPAPRWSTCWSSPPAGRSSPTSRRRRYSSLAIASVTPCARRT
jgi:iron(III) transport system ATP-binding protein